MNKVDFRVYDKITQGIVNVVSINFHTGSLIIESTDDSGMDEIRHLEDVELLQSTGLKDMNNTEIYEGDIVEFKYPYDKRIKTRGKIVRNDDKACFGISMKETTEQYELYRVTAENYLTVIGNIYENPELLEEVK